MVRTTPHATVARPREDRPGLALALLLVTFGMFSGVDTIAKVLVTEGFPPLQVAFMRYAAHAVLLLAFFAPRGPSVFVARRPGLQVLRSLALLASTVLNFAALAFLPLTVTIAIMFSSPLAVCLLSIPVLHEKVGVRRLTGVGIGFLGVLVITQPWAADFHWAIFLSLGAMLSISVYFVLTRLLAGQDDAPVTQLYSSVIPAVAMIPVGWLVWQTPTEPMHWVLLIGIGLLGGIGHGILTLAYRYAEASRLAPVVYSQIVYVTGLSWLVFAAWPTANTMLGTAIIVASGIYIWLRERARAGG